MSDFSAHPRVSEPMSASEADVEALAYSMANAKLGEGDAVRCEKPTGYEIGQARPWARRALYWMGERLSAARRQRDEDEATAIAALQRNLELRIGLGQRPSVDDIAKIVSCRLAASNSEFTSQDAAKAILALFPDPVSP